MMQATHTATIKIYARVTDQGTAMAEAALCAEHYADPELRGYADVVANGAEDVSHTDGWQDASENEALACVECGATVDGLPTTFDLMGGATDE